MYSIIWNFLLISSARRGEDAIRAIWEMSAAAMKMIQIWQEADLPAAAEMNAEVHAETHVVHVEKHSLYSEEEDETPAAAEDNLWGALKVPFFGLDKFSQLIKGYK